MDIHQLHKIASEGDFAGALEASGAQFGSKQANLEAACIAAWCLSRLDRNEEAWEKAVATFAAAEKDLGVAHLITLEALNDSARFASRIGLVDEAVSRGGGVLELRREVLGHNHPKTLTSWTNLITYRHQAGERPSFFECHDLLGSWQAADPEIADKAHIFAMLSIAEIFADVSLAAKAVDHYEQLLGSSHPDTKRAQDVFDRLRRL